MGFDVLDAETGQNIRTYDLPFSVSDMFEGVDGHCLYLCNNYSIHVWDKERERVVNNMQEPSARMMITFTPSKDGQYLFCGCISGAICQWDLGSRTLTRFFDVGTKGILFSAITRDDVHLIIVDTTRAVRLVNTLDLSSRILKDDGEKTTAMVLTKDSRVLITGHPSGLYMWDIRTGVLLRILEDDDEIYSVDQLVVSRDGKNLFSGHPGCVRIWDLETKKCSQVLRYPREFIHKLVVGRDNQFPRIIGTGDLGSMIIWEQEPQDS